MEKEMATHSSVLAWRIPGTGEPSGLPSMGLHRVGHDWSNLAAAAAAFCSICGSYFVFPILSMGSECFSLPNSSLVTICGSIFVSLWALYQLDSSYILVINRSNWKAHSIVSLTWRDRKYIASVTSMLGNLNLSDPFFSCPSQVELLQLL